MRRRGIGIGGLAMVIVAVSFLVFLVATRWGLDLYGPQLMEWMQDLHDKTGWFEGGRGPHR